MKNLKTMFLRKELDFTMVFTIYLYIYTSISTMTNRDSVGYIDNHTHLVMYYLNQLIFVAGLFLNVFFWTRLPKDEHKSLYLKFSAVVFYLGSFVLMLYPSAFSFTVIAPIVHLFLGILGGSVHYFISAALMGTGILGRHPVVRCPLINEKGNDRGKLVNIQGLEHWICFFENL